MQLPSVPEDLDDLDGVWLDLVTRGIDMLIDDLFAELTEFDDETGTFPRRDELPEIWRSGYAAGFIHKLIILAGNMSRKIVVDWTPPECLAEEMLVLFVANKISIIADMEGHVLPTGDWEGDIIELLMPAEDIRFLYSRKYDGIEDSDLARDMGLPNLHTKHAFDPFNGAVLPAYLR